MNISFTKNKNVFFIISLLLCFISIILIQKTKLNLGLEFTGGIEIEILCNKSIKKEILENKLKNFKDLKIKFFGSNKNIQLKIKSKNKNIQEIKKEIELYLNDDIKKKYIKIIKVEYIGPEINEDMIKNSTYSILISILAMIIYLTYRFKLKFAISAIITLLHDIIIIIGIMILLKIELNLTTFAALLSIFGYSINDTVVIFDRIRENINIYKSKDIKSIIDISIKSTLSRTISTSTTTLLVIIIIMIFGGKYLLEFSIVLLFGIIIGTYSSIFIAAMIYLLIYNKKNELSNYL